MLFTKSELRRLRKQARTLQAENPDAGFARTACFQIHFIAGRVVTGRVKSYHRWDDEHCATHQCYQAREPGERYEYGDRLAYSFEELFEQCPGETVFRRAGIGPYAESRS